MHSANAFSLYDWFQKAVMVFLAACFMWITAGTLREIAHVHLISSRFAPFSCFLGLFIVILLYGVMRFGFLFIQRQESLRAQRLITILLFAAMIGVYAVLLHSFDANLRNDCYQDVDTAAYLTNHDHVPVDNKHPGELLSFGNNYFFILMTSRILRILFAMGITDVVPCLQTINAGAMVLGTLIAWCMARDCTDRRAANQMLLLFVANPLFYAFTFWYYSNSLSIPVMMAIPYVAMILYRSSSFWRMLLLGALEGFLLFFGYQLRPTAIFPFAAIVVLFALHFLPMLLRENKGRLIGQLLPAAGMTVIVFCLCMIAFSSVRQSYFGELIPYNRPISYWLSFGSHGDGNLRTSGEDVQYVKSLHNNDDKFALCLKRALHNYKNNGLGGTLDLWARKCTYVWSDGYAHITKHIIAGETESFLLRFLAGSNVALFILYAHAFRLLNLIGLLFFCFRYFGKKLSDMQAVWMVTILGGIIFYLFWEARAVYAAPFIPGWLFLAQSGFAGHFTGDRKLFLGEEGLRPLPVILLFAIALFVSADAVHVLGQPVSANHFRIYTKGKARHNYPIETPERMKLVQDFSVKKSFNTIVIPAKLPPLSKRFSKYRFSLVDDNGKVRYEKEFDSKDIRRDSLKLQFSKIAGGHYTVRIEKQTPSLDSIKFFTKYDSYYIGAYDGQLSVNGDNSYVNDLAMSVLYVSRSEPYLAKVVRLLFVLLLLGWTAIVCLGNIREERIAEAAPKHYTG